MTRICDYEGSKYRTEFWEAKNRDYEDGVERVAMRKLLPPRGGERLVEIGAGFGRLVDLYDRYQQIILVDYARTQLEEARKYLGSDERIIYVVADVYNLPFLDNLFNTLTMVRVMHHLTDVPTALKEIHRIVAPNGVSIIEHASKFHLKSLARWFLGKQSWSPFDHTPIEFVELNFNFHPAWMRQQFKDANLKIENVRSVSHYRIDLLKRLLPISLLVALDSWAQQTGNWWQLSPSLFIRARAQKEQAVISSGLFRCPNCKSPLPPSDTFANKRNLLVCQVCHLGWSLKDGIYDFKNPVSS